MKKALITGIAAALIATTAGAGAVIGTRGWTADDYASSPVVQTAVLKQGSKGGEVKEVQRRLKQWGYYTGSVDRRHLRQSNLCGSGHERQRKRA